MSNSASYMIDYNPRAWVSIIFDVYSQRVMWIMFPLLLFVCVFSVVLTFFVQDYFHIVTYLEHIKVVHSLLGIVLGLFLVFRTNTAYDRWWEGRKIWGRLINDSRSLAIKLAVFLPKREDRYFFSYMIPNFVFAMKEHLRKGVKMEELHFEEEQHREYIAQVGHKPNIIILYMYDKLQALYQNGTITGEQFFILDKEAKAFSDHMGACERIKKTPIPYSYNMYTKKFIFVYSLTLPLAFIPHFGYWSALVVGFVFYILVSIALIAEEIEEPFGTDFNDLPTHRISIAIRTNLEEILVASDARPPISSSAERES